MDAGYDQIISFLKELDHKIKEKRDLYLFGGGAMTLAYDRKNRTADLDFVEAPSDIVSKANQHSPLALKYHVYISFLAEINLSVPRGWRSRCKKLPLELSHLNIWVADVYDIALSKLPRFEPKDIEDLVSLVDKGLINSEGFLNFLNQNLKEFQINLSFLNNVKLAFHVLFNQSVKIKKGRLHVT